ncbi:MAG: ribonuclease G [Gammaproteobacteria bacterium]|nr:ribonuclease G [Gammaproteobacteria bacterium]MDH3505610.1 ribonuclease G [Gammaproteobacteria bacterium]
MKEEILINATPREVRAALVEDGIVQELLIERANYRGLISNIYKGKVARVLPGMQAAFVDLGLERTAFLHASDIGHGVDEEGRDEEVSIRDLVSEGSEIIVQVLKDPLGSKGARLTTQITIPSRYLVMMPLGGGVRVSARIEDEAERERLRGLIEGFSDTEDSLGYIVRTAAEGASAEALHADMQFLAKLWQAIEEAAAQAGPMELVHEDLPLALRVLRDLLGVETERVCVDSEPIYDLMKEFADKFIPQMSPMIEHYTRDRPVFDLYGVEDEIQRALQRKVVLKSGGYLIFDQTEAMTTIDVNTGAYVGHRNLEETIFRTNLEASVAIARQLRLRNLGGIIIIDFIDMAEEEHRSQVLQSLSGRLAGDHAKTQIMDVSPLGLVEMTRKRTRESLEHVLCQACPSCEGRGFVKTAESVCYEIFREILRQHGQFDFQELLVLARPRVIERMLDEESASVAELEELTGATIRLQSESLYAPDQFDVILM